MSLLYQNIENSISCYTHLINHHISMAKKHILQYKIYLNEFRTSVIKNDRLRQDLFENYLKQIDSIDSLINVYSIIYSYVDELNERIVWYWRRINEYLHNFIVYFHKLNTFRDAIDSLLNIYLSQ